MTLSPPLLREGLTSGGVCCLDRPIRVSRSLRTCSALGIGTALLCSQTEPWEKRGQLVVRVQGAPHILNPGIFSKELAVHGCLQVRNTQVPPYQLFQMVFFFRKGLNAKQAEFAMKKYRSHRRCGPAVMMSVEVLLN